MERTPMTLSQCAKYDYENHLASKLTGWGRICKERKEKGISRKEKRKRKK
jgi:hypothetical protein